MSAFPSDRQLITRLQSGDLDALGALYTRHRSLVYRTALSITSDPAAAEDILQDCFLRVHKYAHSVDGSRPLQPWLYWVATNRSYDWKTQSRTQLVPLDDTHEYPSDSSPEHRAEARDLEHRVKKCISRLNAKQRDVIVLYYHAALSLKEIAGLLGCPVGTVKSRLHYAREALRHELEASHNVTTEVVGDFI